MKEKGKEKEKIIFTASLLNFFDRLNAALRSPHFFDASQAPLK